MRKREASRINAVLHLIKIYFSLIQKTLEENSDRAIAFIKIIKELKNPITYYFEDTLKFIQEGQNPEKVLEEIITFSDDFDYFLKEMLLNEFENLIINNEGAIEHDFKIYIRQIETRLSILFFIGTFFPIGISFILLFQLLNSIILISLLPFYYFIIRIISKKFVKKDLFLIGLIQDYSKREKLKFDEFMLFLKRFALNLRSEISPEVAFIETFFQLKSRLKDIYKTLETQTNNLSNITFSFSDMINQMKNEFNSKRFSIILTILERLVLKNSFEASFKIFEILDLLYYHQRLEKKLKIIIKGEKFKAIVFLFILPTVLGIIGGIFPSFILLFNDIEIQTNIFNHLSVNKHILFDIIVLFSFYLTCLTISSYFFLNVLNFERSHYIILFIIVIYIFLFIISFLNFSNII